MELVELLNLLYSAFDEIIMDWGVHKVAPRPENRQTLWVNRVQLL